VAIGHTRYSTTGASIWENAQPTFRTTATGHLALGHNGNLTNTGELRKRIAELHSGSGELPFNATIAATTDTEILTARLAAHQVHHGLEANARKSGRLHEARVRAREGAHGWSLAVSEVWLLPSLTALVEHHAQDAGQICRKF
jgi:glutamine phosphoribosylpyrophosphate amidotransferase